MFDYLLYEGKEHQTKDTPQQAMDTYEIRGKELWWKKTEYEWVEDGGLFGGYLKEVSHEWVFCDRFDGVIDFYRDDKEKGSKESIWIEYHSLFNNGVMIKLERKDEDSN